MTSRADRTDPYKRGPYNALRGEFANVRMPDGRIEQIPWDWMDGNLQPIKVSRRKAQFCDAQGLLTAMEAERKRRIRENREAREANAG